MGRRDGLPTHPKAVKTPRLPSYFDFLRTRYHFENDGTGRKEIMARIRIVNKMGAIQRSQLSFGYKPLSQSLDIVYVRVRRHDGIVVRAETGPLKGDRGQAKQVPEFDYDEKRVHMQGLAPGDVIEYTVITAFHRPLATGKFFVEHHFQQDAALDEQLDIDVPKGRTVKVKALSSLKAWETDDEKRKTYHWRSLNPDLQVRQGVGASSERIPDVQVSSFTSWEEVGRWYADLETKRRVPSPEVRAKADELTRGLDSSLEKVESLYNFTAKKIKYISLISLGVGGYEPHSAEETLHKGYGDCKDKVALLAALLEAEGMNTSTVLINPSRPLDADFPSPWPFTHVIALLTLGKDEIWMDPSPAVLPFRMLEYHLRKRPALVVPPSGTPHFEETPADAPVPNTWLEEIDGKLSENGTLEATVSIIARGDAELSLRRAFLNPVKSVRPSVVYGLFKDLHQTDKVREIDISDPTLTNVPFRVSFRISKTLFLNIEKGTVGFTLPLSDFDLPAPQDDDLVHLGARGRLKLQTAGERTYKIRIELAQHFKPELPSDIVLECDYGTYRGDYKLVGKSVIVERKLITYKNEMPLTLINGYVDFRSKVIGDSTSDLRLVVLPSVTQDLFSR